MALKKKKKKQKASTPVKMMQKMMSKNELEHKITIIKNIIKAEGYDPDIFDVFTKNLKQQLLFFSVDTPRIQAAEGHRVPKQYLSYIHKNFYSFAHNTCYKNDTENGLTIMEILTVALAFAVSLSECMDRGRFTPEMMNTVDILNKIFDINGDIINEGIEKMVLYIEFLIQSLTQMNYRIYSFTWKYSARDNSPYKSGICIYAETAENEYLNFTHNGKNRKGYRVTLGRGYFEEQAHACVRYRDIYPGMKSDKKMPVYIQTHALHRFKQRMDVVDPATRNLYILSNLYTHPKMIFGPSGQRLLVCRTGVDATFGYFGYIIQNEALFVTTFLPLTSPETPEGSKFMQITGLTVDDIILLGMDKIGFYFAVDTDEIPVLKDALEESGINKSMKIFTSKDMKELYPVNEQKTTFVKKFFTIDSNSDPHDFEIDENM